MKDNKDIRVGIYYSTAYGRNDGSPLYYFNVLKNQLGFHTFHLVPTGDTLKDVGPLDLHFWVDWGEDALGFPEWDIPKDGGKTIYVASDTHLDNGYRLKKAEKFDFVFFNQEAAAGEFDIKNPGKRSVWLPHAAEPFVYNPAGQEINDSGLSYEQIQQRYDSLKDIEVIKRYDVCFVGHMQNDAPNYNNMSRVQALDKLFKEVPNFYYGSRHPAFPGKNLFEDVARKFTQSKIVFNISIKDDINMRVFETLATKSFLLTNWLPTLGELFEDGIDLVTYKTEDEMVEKAKYYLTHDKERQKIAEHGYNTFMAGHTYKHRVEKILEVINSQKV